MDTDVTTLSTAELKKALHGRATPEQLAQCLERPDFEALYKQVAHRPPPPPQQQQQQQQRPPPPQQQQRPPPAATTEAENGGLFGVGWQTWALIAMGVYMFMGQGGGGGSADGPAAPVDEAFITGHVAEVTTVSAFKAALALHRDHTGLPYEAGGRTGALASQCMRTGAFCTLPQLPL